MSSARQRLAEWRQLAPEQRRGAGRTRNYTRNAHRQRRKPHYHKCGGTAGITVTGAKTPKYQRPLTSIRGFRTRHPGGWPKLPLLPATDEPLPDKPFSYIGPEGQGSPHGQTPISARIFMRFSKNANALSGLSLSLSGHCKLRKPCQENALEYEQGRLEEYGGIPHWTKFTSLAIGKEIPTISCDSVRNSISRIKQRQCAELSESLARNRSQIGWSMGCGGWNIAVMIARASAWSKAVN